MKLLELGQIRAFSSKFTIFRNRSNKGFFVENQSEIDLLGRIVARVVSDTNHYYVFALLYLFTLRIQIL